MDHGKKDRKLLKKTNKGGLNSFYEKSFWQDSIIFRSPIALIKESQHKTPNTELVEFYQIKWVAFPF